MLIGVSLVHNPLPVRKGIQPGELWANIRPSEAHTENGYDHLEGHDYCLLSREVENWKHDQIKHTHTPCISIALKYIAVDIESKLWKLVLSGEYYYLNPFGINHSQWSTY